jgi:multidrug efflux pump subunit AcrA (membrane-fusion protein)
LIIIYLAWFWFSNSKDSSQEIVYIEHVVGRGTIADLLIASGSTEIDKKINLSFGTNGEILKVNVKEGDQVNKDQLIAELNSYDLENALERSKIQLEKLKIQLEKLNAYPSQEEINSAQYLVSQAENNLKQLKDFPSDEQLKAAKELVTLAEANYILAKNNYNELINPTDSQLSNIDKLIVQAEYTLSNANLQLDNSKINQEAKKIVLIETINTYCDNEELPNRGDVCNGDFTKIPFPKSITDAIIDKIFTCCNANPTEMDLSKTLISANADYSSSIEQVIVSQNQIDSSSASLIDVQITKEKLLNPSQEDIDRLSKLETQAKENLDRRLLSLEDIKSGTDPDEITLAEENLKKTQLSLENVKKGTDKNDLLSQQNDISIQQYLVSQAEENLLKTKLFASFEGQISSINYKEGEFIGSGQSFVTLTDPLSTQMNIVASEAEFIEIEEGMYGIVALDSMPESPLIIQVTSILEVPNVQQGVVTYPVTARFIQGFEIITVIGNFAPLIQSLAGSIDPSSIPSFGQSDNTSGNRPNRMEGLDFSNLNKTAQQGIISNFLSGSLPAEGMNGTVTLLQKSVQDVLIVPSTAIVVEKGIAKVITSSNSSGVEYKEVKTGLTDGENTEIIEGLLEGDSIFIKTIVDIETTNDQKEMKSIDELTEGPPRGGPPPRGGR